MNKVQEATNHRQAQTRRPYSLRDLRILLLHVAWLSILLGIVMETLGALVLIPVLRGVEYLLLGLAIGWVAQQVWGGLKAHAATGLVVSLIF